MGLRVGGNCISSQPVLPSNVCRAASATIRRRNTCPANNQRETSLKIYERQSWENYITDCCRDCDNLETIKEARGAWNWF